MSQLDSILKQISGSPDTVASIAQKVGLDPALVEKGLAALGQAHGEPGDTVEQASRKTQLDTGTLGSIMAQMGGEGAVGEMAGKAGGSGHLSSLNALLDRDGDGSAMNDVAGMASKFLKR